MRLRPGQSADVGGSAGAPIDATPATIATPLQARLHFEATPIAQAMAAVSRDSANPLQLERSVRRSDLRVSGSFV